MRWLIIGYVLSPSFCLILILRIRKNLPISPIATIPTFLLALLRPIIIPAIVPVVSRRLVGPISIRVCTLIIHSIVESQLASTFRIGDNLILIAIEPNPDRGQPSLYLVIIAIDDKVDLTTLNIEPIIVPIHSQYHLRITDNKQIVIPTRNSIDSLILY